MPGANESGRSSRPPPSLTTDGLVRVAQAGLPRLAGFTVAVATDRRRHPIAADLERHGARVVSVQASRTFAQPDPPKLAAATLAAITAPADDVIVSSALGLRAWMAAARSIGVGDQVLRLLDKARLLAGDARAADGLRELGFTRIWSTAAGTVEELFAHLLAQPLDGRRVIVQVDGESTEELAHALALGAAEVVEVPTFRAEPPRHRDVLRRLVDLIVRRQVDGVALTSAAGVDALLEQATVDGCLDGMLNAVADAVVCVCLGKLTAAPLLNRGVRPHWLGRPVVEELLEAMLRELPGRAIDLVIAGHDLQIRGQAVLVGQALIPIQPGPIAVLRVLAQQPGRVLSMDTIRRQIPGSSTSDDPGIVRCGRSRHRNGRVATAPVRQRDQPGRRGCGADRRQARLSAGRLVCRRGPGRVPRRRRATVR